MTPAGPSRHQPESFSPPARVLLVASRDPSSYCQWVLRVASRSFLSPVRFLSYSVGVSRSQRVFLVARLDSSLCRWVLLVASGFVSSSAGPSRRQPGSLSSLVDPSRRQRVLLAASRVLLVSSRFFVVVSGLLLVASGLLLVASRLLLVAS